jgi:hypothetical protein
MICCRFAFHRVHLTRLHCNWIQNSGNVDINDPFNTCTSSYNKNIIADICATWVLKADMFIALVLDVVVPLGYSKNRIMININWARLGIILDAIHAHVCHSINRCFASILMSGPSVSAHKHPADRRCFGIPDGS